jgi:hypothetical protein
MLSVVFAKGVWLRIVGGQLERDDQRGSSFFPWGISV